MKYLIIALGLNMIFSVANADITTTEPRSAQAKQLTSSLMGQLKKELIAGLKQGSEAAINICRLRAPQISQQLSSDGVKIGRVSHRPRNPENKVQSWQNALMADYLSQGTAQPSKSVILADGSLGFVKPIYMAAPCLRCHGKHISANLSQEIDKYYPQDMAYGFKLGELRGLAWVIIH